MLGGTPRIPAAVAIAIVRAQAHAQGITKSGWNDEEGYAYVRADQVIEEARAALFAADLGVVREEWKLAPSPIEGQPARVVVQYLVILDQGDEGPPVVWRPPPASTPVVVEGRKGHDKAEAAALTYNLAYWLVGLLLLPRLEREADVDARGGADKPTAADRRSSAPKRERSKPGDAGAEALIAVIKKATKAADLKGCRARLEHLRKEGLSAKMDEAVREALDLRAGELTPVDGEGAQSEAREGAAA